MWFGTQKVVSLFNWRSFAAGQPSKFRSHWEVVVSILNSRFASAVGQFSDRATRAQFERQQLEEFYTGLLMLLLAGWILAEVVYNNVQFGGWWQQSWLYLANFYAFEVSILVLVLFSGAFTFWVSLKIVAIHNWILMVKRGWPWALNFSFTLGRCGCARRWFYPTPCKVSSKIAEVVGN
jgi:hypothetical protein